MRGIFPPHPDPKIEKKIERWAIVLVIAVLLPSPIIWVSYRLFFLDIY